MYKERLLWLKIWIQLYNLQKHRGFVFPGSDIYGGLSNTWDYGPLGVELKIILKSLVAKIYYAITIQCRY